MRRDKNMDQSIKSDESSKNRKWQENNRERKTLEVAATKKETNSGEVDNYKSLLSDLTFTFGAAPDIVQTHSMSDTKSIS